MSLVPGSKMVGADKVKDYEQKAAGQEAALIPGSRLTGTKRGAKPGAKRTLADPAPIVAHYALDEIVKELAKTPSAVDRILKAELARAEGPRKTALQRLRAAEYARAEKAKTEPRAEVLAAIDEKLGRKPVEPVVPAPGAPEVPAPAAEPDAPQGAGADNDPSPA